jgi:hypothetical protein
MKTYKITISGKEIEVTQNEDGSFNKPDIVKELEPIGTALKPAFEPICIAMKPLSEKNYVANVLKWGTGGINIDESRVEYQGDADWNNTFRPSTNIDKNCWIKDKNAVARVDIINRNGRFPANLILGADENGVHEEVRECFPETKSGGGNKATKTAETFLGTGFGGTDNSVWECDSGNASRFFRAIPQVVDYNKNIGERKRFKSIIYTAKASKSERNRGCDELEEKVKTEEYSGRDTKCSVCGKFFLSSTNPCNCSEEEFGAKSTRIQNPVSKNNHPTVKPIALMEYLIKMVTKPGGIVLDPFAGSGSTLVAAKQNGFQYIGIELTEEYIPIIEARLLGVENDINLSIKENK